jgi:hypothetical protein
MNERIKELSNIAYMNHVERNPHSSFGRRYDYDKEFAELIIKECTENFAKVWYDQGLDVRGAELNKVMLQFNKHFGVEK